MRQLRIGVGARGALLCLCILGVLAGCAGREDCSKPGFYSTSTVDPPLRVPPDLSQPPANETFELPPGPTDATANPPCGHYPPKLGNARSAAEGASAAAPAVATAPPQPVPPPPAEAAAPAPATATGVVAGAAAASPRETAASAPPAPTDVLQSELRAFVEAWAQSWSAGDFERYVGYYASDFDPPGDLTAEEWQTARRGLLEKRQTTSVFVDTMTVEDASADRAVVHFIQRSELEGVVSSLRKGLELVREGDAWRIQKELIVEVLPNPR